jgi:DNA-binding phage protein
MTEQQKLQEFLAPLINDVTLERRKRKWGIVKLSSKAGISLLETTRFLNAHPKTKVITLFRIARALGWELQIKLIPIRKKKTKLDVDRIKKLKIIGKRVSLILDKAGLRIAPYNKKKGVPAILTSFKKLREDNNNDVE